MNVLREFSQGWNGDEKVYLRPVGLGLGEEDKVIPAMEEKPGGPFGEKEV